MDRRDKPIGTRNARTAAEKFVLDKYPYSNCDFDRIELRNDGALQVYELLGSCRLIKWPNAVGRKSQCKIQVNAYSADVVDYFET